MPTFNFEAMEQKQKENLRAFGNAVRARAKRENGKSQHRVALVKETLITQAVIIDKARAIETEQESVRDNLDKVMSRISFMEEQASAKAIRKCTHSMNSKLAYA